MNARRHPALNTALGGGTNKLAVPAAVRAEIGKDAGDTVEIHLRERIPPTARKALDEPS